VGRGCAAEADDQRTGQAKFDNTETARGDRKHRQQPDQGERRK